MPRPLYIINGLQLSGEVEVELPSRCSFDPWAQRIMNGWHQRKGRYDPSLRNGPVKLTLSRIDTVELLLLAYPQERSEVESNVAKCIHDMDPTTLTVLDVEHGRHGHNWDSGWVVSCLRLFCPGDIGPSGFLVPAEGENEGTLSEPLLRIAPSWRDALLSPEETTALGPFLVAMAGLTPTFHAKGMAALNIARRYYAKSLHRDLSMGHVEHPDREFQAGYTRLEDVVLNLTIALEALFTLGSTSHEELEKRLVRRILSFWDNSLESTPHLEATVRWAYDVRSQVAHGSFKGFARKERYRPVFSSDADEGEAVLTARLRDVVRRSIAAMASVLSQNPAKKAIRKALDEPDDHADQLREIHEHRDLVSVLPYDKDIAITNTSPHF